MILYAYDPGGTTGFARFEFERVERTARLVSAGELNLWHGIDQQLIHADEVVYEMIVPRHPSFNPIGLQVVGVIRYLCELQKVPASHQMNSQIHGIAKWGKYDNLWKDFTSPHARDAIQHGVVWLHNAKYIVRPRNPS